MFKYVMLMNVDCNEGFKLNTLYFSKIGGGLSDELVQHVQEHTVRGGHYFPTVVKNKDGIFNSYFCFDMAAFLNLHSAYQLI